MPGSETLQLYGSELELEPVEPRPGGGARIDVTHEDGRRWRVDVTSMGELDEIVTTWQDGQLADLEEPDWFDDALARIARAV